MNRIYFINFLKGMKALVFSFPLLLSEYVVASNQLPTEIQETGNLASKEGSSQTAADSVVELNEVEIRTRKYYKQTKSNGKLRFDTRELDLNAHVLGEADILFALKTLPGIVSVGDYGSGIMIDGTESSQTVYEIADAPLFFPYRFGGVFSVFNNAYFSQVDFKRNIHDASAGRCVGGEVMLQPYSNTEGMQGEVNVGVIASSAALRYGDGKRWSVGAGGRISYLDKIYGRWLKTDDAQIGYDFSDINVGGSLLLSPDDRLSLEYFQSADNLNISGGSNDMTTLLKWKNRVVSTRWEHEASEPEHFSSALTGYFSEYNSKFNMNMAGIALHCPSGIKDGGISLGLRVNPGGSDYLRLLMGLAGDYYSATPQYCMKWGIGADEPIVKPSQKFYATRLYGDMEVKLNELWKLSGGLSVGYYRNKSYGRFLVDPRITFNWNISRDRLDRLTLHAGVYHQYLHQTGFSEIGMASNFWSGATSCAGVTSVYNFVAVWRRNFPGIVDLEAETYYKIIKDSPEFVGSLFDLIGNDYDALKEIYPASGYSYGFGLQASKEFGDIMVRTGMSFGDGRRRIGKERMWCSRTSQGCVLKIEGNWKLGDRWTLSALFKYASGRPYTPVKTIYLVAGNILMEYGKRNSARLPSYQRLDLSGSYTFHTGGKLPLKHIVNISLLNAYGHKNVEMQYYSIDRDKNVVKLKQLCSLYRFLPSLSYTIFFE